MSGGKDSETSAMYAEALTSLFVEAIQRSSVSAAQDCGDGEEVTLALLECLKFLNAQGPVPVRRIAHALGVSLPAASQLVDRLVRKSLAARSEYASDRRVAWIALTESGSGVLNRACRRKSDWFESVIRTMSSSSRDALVEGMEDFLRVALIDNDEIERACERCNLKHAHYCVVSKIKAGLSLDSLGHG